jgi:signal transduction histidine kinase
VKAAYYWKPALFVGFILVLAALHVTTQRQRQVREHSETLTQLEGLAAIQTEIGEVVLASRVGLEHNYDGVVAARTRFAEQLEELEPRLAADAAEEAEIVPMQQRLVEQAAAFGESLERFKREQAVLRNSVRYLPEATEGAVSEADRLDPDHPRLHYRQIAVQLLDCVLNQTLDCPVRERVEDLNARRAELPPQLASLAVHARTVLEKSRVVAGLVRDLYGHPLSTDIAALLRHYSDRVERMHGELHQIERGFALLSIALILAVAVTLLALDRSRHELAEVNAGLEQQVRDRSAQLAQAQKLEAVGQLASGMAHEINTPAQFVSDNLQFLSESFGELRAMAEQYGELLGGAADEAAVAERRAGFDAGNLDFLLKEIPEALEQSRSGIGRVTEIVRAMKEFSHPGSGSFTLADLNRAVESTVIVARNEWKYCAELALDLDPEMTLVPCLPGELNQAILNMVVNAAHAIADKYGDGQLGHIRIVTKRHPDCAEIQIQDDGPGIPPGVRDRIFEPFFTTKEVGKGTGQGLAIARSIIVEKHGGTLDLETEVGAGTTLRIRLPVERADAVAEEAA